MLWMLPTKLASFNLFLGHHVLVQSLVHSPDQRVLVLAAQTVKHVSDHSRVEAGIHCKAVNRRCKLHNGWRCPSCLMGRL